MQAQAKAEKTLQKAQAKELKYKKGLLKVQEKYNKQVAVLEKAQKTVAVSSPL